MLLFQHKRVCVFIVWATVAAAQTPKFDVASVKAIPPPVGAYRADFGTASHGQLTLTNVTFSECARYAFGIGNDYQIAGPTGSSHVSFCSTLSARLLPTRLFPNSARCCKPFLPSAFSLRLTASRERSNTSSLAFRRKVRSSKRPTHKQALPQIRA
jgi:hypothetical protein